MSRRRYVMEIQKTKSVITPALVQSIIPQNLEAISQEKKSLNDYKIVVLGGGIIKRFFFVYYSPVVCLFLTAVLIVEGVSFRVEDLARSVVSAIW